MPNFNAIPSPKLLLLASRVRVQSAHAGLKIDLDTILGDPLQSYLALRELRLSGHEKLIALTDEFAHLSLQEGAWPTQEEILAQYKANGNAVSASAAWDPRLENIEISASSHQAALEPRLPTKSVRDSGDGSARSGLSSLFNKYAGSRSLPASGVRSELAAASGLSVPASVPSTQTKDSTRDSGQAGSGRNYIRGVR